MACLHGLKGVVDIGQCSFNKEQSIVDWPLGSIPLYIDVGWRESKDYDGSTVRGDVEKNGHGCSMTQWMACLPQTEPNQSRTLKAAAMHLGP